MLQLCIIAHLHARTCAGAVTYGTGRITITDKTKRNKGTRHFPSNIISLSASHASLRGKPLLDLSPEESLIYNSLFISLFSNSNDLSFKKKKKKNQIGWSKILQKRVTGGDFREKTSEAKKTRFCRLSGAPGHEPRQRLEHPGSNRAD